MLEYFRSGDESRCCGCGACKVSCPKDAISMGPNSEGFLYPKADMTRCVSCHICEKVCPMTNPPDRQQPLSVYALQHKDAETLKSSSSGGAFRLIADAVIDCGGAVAGCVWNERWEPVITIAKSRSELLPMQGSKYLYSNAGDSYCETRRLLDNGKTVLYTGTPCQLAGLVNFLSKPYDNLLTLEFLCHGVPSQKAFDAFVEDRRRKFGGGQLEAFSFRDKTLHGWAQSESMTIAGKKHYLHGLTSPYLFGFLEGFFNRYSCYTCPFRGEERFTDFTVCDFWGYGKSGGINSKDGISAVQINTEKARKMFDLVKAQTHFHAVERAQVAVENPAISSSAAEAVPELRLHIYGLLCEHGWHWVEKRYLRCDLYLLKRLWYALPNSAVRKIKNCAKKILSR